MLTNTRPPNVADIPPSPSRRAPVIPADKRRATATHPPRWLRELALVAVLYVVYDTTRGLRQGSIAGANRHGWRLLSWERALHLDPEHTLNQLLSHTPALGVPASYFYAALHFIITPAVLIWLYRRHPGNYRSARTAILIGTALALVIFWIDPTTPPRLLPGGTFHDILGQNSQWGWWGSEGSAPRGLGNLTNQLAAMPSLHVGWALWSGWLIARHARRPVIRLLGVAYPIVTTLVVLGTGNHYLFDALAGAAVIAVGAAVATLAARRTHLEPRPRQWPRTTRTGPKHLHRPSQADSTPTRPGSVQSADEAARPADLLGAGALTGSSNASPAYGARRGPPRGGRCRPWSPARRRCAHHPVASPARRTDGITITSTRPPTQVQGAGGLPGGKSDRRPGDGGSPGLLPY